MVDKKNNLEMLTLGLDIGIASVGWTLLGKERIIDIGVRCFDRAETADKGESLNLARRTARLARRRLRRRAWRLTKLARLLHREGLITSVDLLKTPPSEGLKVVNPWRLRVEGLDRKLGNEDWARVIYHVCKHRGFHWVSKAEANAADKDKEGGKVKQGLAGTARLMGEKGYRSAAEMVFGEFVCGVEDEPGESRLDRVGEPIPLGAARNKQGEYSKALSRDLLGQELKYLFGKQRHFGNPHASEAFELEILGNGDKKSGLFWSQNPALSGDDLLKMLGHCTFEKEEYRAPKASFTAERHVLLTRINNLRLIEDGQRRALTPEERQIALLQPYRQVSDFTYKQLGAALIKAGYLIKGGFRFAGLSYPRESDEKAKDPESAVLAKLPAWQLLKKTLEGAGLGSEWNQMSGEAMNGDPHLLDQIAWVLSVYKDDGEVEEQLQKLALPGGEKMIESLQIIRFDTFSNLSLKALRRIVPYMENGLRYDEACRDAGYHHSLPEVDQKGSKRKYLPGFYSGRDEHGQLILNDEMDIPRNPVVLRALNQARKVVNALIRKYGSPHAVHIEMARDLSRPFDERKKIARAQDEYRARNRQDRETFATEFDIVGIPKARDIEKWRLYREQQGKSAYSLEPIDLDRLLEWGYVEVDHVLPYSRSYDDSKNNRVLVLIQENQNKGNRTPYEYLDGKNDSEAWRRFEAFVMTNKSYRQAKRNHLLKRDFSGEEAAGFRDRHLNDTRYICRFFKNYVEKYLQLSETSSSQRCVVLSGRLTAFLRFHWGLNKVRSESDRHHALDAAVVAACGHGMVKRLSDYSRRRELEQARDVIDAETGEIVNPELLNKLEQDFPEPWAHFRDEVMARIKTDNRDTLHAALVSLGNYPADVLDSVKPLFVSRAPRHRNSGAAHKETIYSQPPALKETGSVKQKVDVTALKASDIDRLVDPERNEKLYAYLKQWVAGRDERIKRARDIEKTARSDRRELSLAEKEQIAELTALPRKPDKNGNPTGPLVRTVTMLIDKLSGIPVRGGIARNDTMLRVDVFEKAGKFYLVPVYVYHAAAKELPNHAAKANTPHEDWTSIDDSYTFRFTLYPNDLIRLKNRNAEYFGYFAGMGITTASLSIKSHDNNEQIAQGKKWQGTWVNLGVKTGIQCFEKFHVDVLGNVYPAPPEVRRDLA